MTSEKFRPLVALARLAVWAAGAGLMYWLSELGGDWWQLLFWRGK